MSDENPAGGASAVERFVGRKENDMTFEDFVAGEFAIDNDPATFEYRLAKRAFDAGFVAGREPTRDWFDPETGEQRVTPRPAAHKRPPPNVELTGAAPTGGSNLDGAASGLSDVLGVTDAMVDAFIAFAEKGSYLSHPAVPYHGVTNGDNAEKWHRRYVKAALSASMTPTPVSGAGRRPVPLETIVRSCATNNACALLIVVTQYMHDQRKQEQAMDTSKTVNYVQARNGKVMAVCQCCGAQSRPVIPCSDGEPDLWNMARGWSEAPYPVGCQHSDGTSGSTYTCPKCNKRLRAGETLTLRQYLRGTNE